MKMFMFINALHMLKPKAINKNYHLKFEIFCRLQKHDYRWTLV